jgi:hypothetical protein
MSPEAFSIVMKGGTSFMSKPGEEIKRTSSKSKSQSHKLTEILSGNKAL